MSSILKRTSSPFILLFLVVVMLGSAYVTGWLFWSWLLMLFMGAFGPHGSYQWSYTYVLTHWGLLTPFILG